jgi:hypothetical protein
MMQPKIIPRRANKKFCRRSQKAALEVHGVFKKFFALSNATVNNRSHNLRP